MKSPVTYYDRKKPLIRDKARREILNTIGGKVIYGLKKRPYTDRCEFCQLTTNKAGKPIKLNYHHWIPDNPALGLWLCNKCHTFAEVLDGNDMNVLIERYLMLKRYAVQDYHQN